MSKHIHRYQRALSGNKTIFKCNLPDCTHYLYKELAENKLTLCNSCGSQMLLTKEKMKRVKPHCDKCTKSKKQERINTLKEILSDLSVSK